jgi:hypothetical protein
VDVSKVATLRRPLFSPISHTSLELAWINHAVGGMALSTISVPRTLISVQSGSFSRHHMTRDTAARWMTPLTPFMDRSRSSELRMSPLTNSRSP